MKKSVYPQRLLIIFKFNSFGSLHLGTRVFNDSKDISYSIDVYIRWIFVEPLIARRIGNEFFPLNATQWMVSIEPEAHTFLCSPLKWNYTSLFNSKGKFFMILFLSDPILTYTRSDIRIFNSPIRIFFCRFRYTRQ